MSNVFCIGISFKRYSFVHRRTAVNIFTAFFFIIIVIIDKRIVFIRMKCRVFQGSERENFRFSVATANILAKNFFSHYFDILLISYLF